MAQVKIQFQFRIDIDEEGTISFLGVWTVLTEKIKFSQFRTFWINLKKFNLMGFHAGML